MIAYAVNQHSDIVSAIELFDVGQRNRHFSELGIKLLQNDFVE
jgi:hypothetical protein